MVDECIRVVHHPVVCLKYLRSKELLFRWIEMSALSDVIFRSHMGNLPGQSAQVRSATPRHMPEHCEMVKGDMATINRPACK